MLSLFGRLTIDNRPLLEYKVKSTKFEKNINAVNEAIYK